MRVTGLEPALLAEIEPNGWVTTVECYEVLISYLYQNKDILTRLISLAYPHKLCYNKI